MTICEYEPGELFVQVQVITIDIMMYAPYYCSETTGRPDSQTGPLQAVLTCLSA